MIFIGLKGIQTTSHFYFGFSIAPTPSESYGDFQLFLGEEDSARANIETFACMGRTTDAHYKSYVFIMDITLVK